MLNIRDFSSSTREFLGAMAEENFVHNPTTAISRTAELFYAKHNFPAFESQEISPDEANERYGIKGHLTFDKPIRSLAAQILHDRKKAEIRRQEVMARTNGGFAQGVTGFGVGLAVSMLDPLNIATAFIPVVGEAKLASLLAKPSIGAVQRFGVRATVGAANALIGTAALEPIVYGAAKYEQSDYGLTDSAFNLTFGALMGAGFRGGGGMVADGFSRLHRKTQRGVVRGAIAEGLQGTRIEKAPKISELDFNLGEIAAKIDKPDLTWSEWEQFSAFVKNTEGQIDFGRMMGKGIKEAGFHELPIRLQEGWHNLETNRGFGKAHMEARIDQFKDKGFDTVEEFVSDVVNDFDEIRQGRGDSVILIKYGEPRKNRVAFLELDPRGSEEFYSVNSGFVTRNARYYQKRQPLWERSPSRSLQPSDSVPKRYDGKPEPEGDVSYNLDEELGLVKPLTRKEFQEKSQQFAQQKFEQFKKEAVSQTETTNLSEPSPSNEPWQFEPNRELDVEEQMKLIEDDFDRLEQDDFSRMKLTDEEQAQWGSTKEKLQTAKEWMLKGYEALTGCLFKNGVANG